MKRITEQTVTAFINGKNRSISNTVSTGDALLLHGNMIAQRIDGKVLATNAGWPTVTTRERLNGLPDIWFRQHKGEQVVSFRRDENDDNLYTWDGSWIWIGASNMEEAHTVAKELLDKAVA